MIVPADSIICAGREVSTMVQEQAHAIDDPRLVADRRDPPLRNLGTWRGPTEELWLRRLLRGAPLPRPSARPHIGLVRHV